MFAIDRKMENDTIIWLFCGFEKSDSCAALTLSCTEKNQFDWCAALNHALRRINLIGMQHLIMH